MYQLIKFKPKCDVDLTTYFVLTNERAEQFAKKLAIYVYSEFDTIGYICFTYGDKELEFKTETAFFDCFEYMELDKDEYNVLLKIFGSCFGEFAEEFREIAKG